MLLLVSCGRTPALLFCWAVLAGPSPFQRLTGGVCRVGVAQVDEEMRVLLQNLKDMVDAERAAKLGKKGKKKKKKAKKKVCTPWQPDVECALTKFGSRCPNFLWARL